MKVTKENCEGCSVFDTDKFKSNMIENDICHKRNSVGCPREEVTK